MADIKIDQIIQTKLTVSAEMQNAIRLWEKMYQDKSPWLKNGRLNGETAERVTSLGIPAYIASKKAELATLEMKTEILPLSETEEVIDETTGLQYTTDKTVGNSARAEFLNEQYNNTIVKDIRVQLEYALAMGGMVIKPYIVQSGDSYSIAMDYIQAGGFYPIAFDSSGRMTEAAFIQNLSDKDYTYTRVEHHVLNGGIVTVTNKAFKKTNDKNKDATVLGREIPLTDVSEWADIEPSTDISGVERLLFAYFKPPIANTVDTYSPLGVSVYSRAVNLIKDADEQYSRLLWEFEGSELAVDVDRDALTLRKDRNGNDITVIPKKQERLFRKLDLGNDETYNVFSPAIRDVNIINGLNNILMQIEDKCGVARGTLTNINESERTATEVVASKQPSYAANALIQSALETVLRDVVYVMNVYADLYNITPSGDYDVTFEWDDSIVDIDSELTKRLSLLHDGITSKAELRMWYFGESEEQALNSLKKIQQYNVYEAQQELQSDLEGE